MKKLLFTSIFLLGLTTAFLGCQKKDDPLSITPQSIELFHNEKGKINVHGTEEAINYKSENPLIATVSEEGVVTGSVRGETNILISAGGRKSVCKVLVKTRINSISEPAIELFGRHKNDVKDELIKRGEKPTATDDGIVYVKIIDGTKVGYVYLFENEKLNGCLLAVPLISPLATVVADFALERYYLVSRTGEYSFAMISPLKDYAVQLSANDDIVSLLYVPYKEVKKQTEIKELSLLLR